MRENSGRFDLCGGNEARQLRMRQCAGAEESLIKVAAPFDEQRQLAGAFDPFHNDLQTQLARKLDQRLDHDAITLTTPPLDILSFAMVVGRLAPLGMLWWMAQSSEKADLPVG